MNTLGFARSSKAISAVIQTLRDQRIKVSGPYRRRNGTLIYSLDDCVVTELELLDLEIAGKLHAAGASELATRIRNSARM
jgi:hypothetical protein